MLVYRIESSHRGEKIEHGLSDQTHSFSLLVISNDVLHNSIYARWKEHLSMRLQNSPHFCVFKCVRAVDTTFFLLSCPPLSENRDFKIQRRDNNDNVLKTIGLKRVRFFTKIQHQIKNPNH